MTPQIPVSSVLDEETARAEVYGLLSALYYAPPSPELLAQIRVAVTEAPAAGGFLEEPWRALVTEARALTDAQVQGEFNALFAGVGKPEVNLYGSHYPSGFLNEKPLAVLRAGHAYVPVDPDLLGGLVAAKPVFCRPRATLGAGHVRRGGRPPAGALLRGAGRFHPRVSAGRGPGFRHAGLTPRLASFSPVPDPAGQGGHRRWKLAPLRARAVRSTA